MFIESVLSLTMLATSITPPHCAAACIDDQGRLVLTAMPSLRPRYIAGWCPSLTFQLGEVEVYRLDGGKLDAEKLPSLLLKDEGTSSRWPGYALTSVRGLPLQVNLQKFGKETLIIVLPRSFPRITF